MAPGHEGREWESHHEVDRTIRRYFRELSELVPHLPYNSITEIVAIFLEAFAEQRTVYVFGNGGSAASASHLMCDINKGASARRGEAPKSDGAYRQYFTDYRVGQ